MHKRKMLALILFFSMGCLFPSLRLAANSNLALHNIIRRNYIDDNLKASTDLNQNRVLWTEPVDIQDRNLLFGIGGKDGSPETSQSFTFIDVPDANTTEKIIQDDKGRIWTVTDKSEAMAETAASRIIWAIGYFVDQSYFVRKVHVEGKNKADLKNVRFKRRIDSFVKPVHWSWASNPFFGSQQIEGLKVVMALLNNWDLSDDNNLVFSKDGMDTFYTFDLRKTLGRTSEGLFSGRTVGKPKDFAKEKFIQKVEDGLVVFNYQGIQPSIVQGVSLEHARLTGNLLGRLSDAQLSDAFKAGGFDGSDVAKYVQATRSRIKQLQDLH